jgi:hypothetical protein
VALILAVNPGNQHSPTLARLARELPGCELIGAESCAVAIKAIKKRVPDVLLLPAATARGEADLIAHLKSVPGGVLTLKLPPVESADPVDLARQIREMLTGVPTVRPPAPARIEVPTLNDAAEPGTSPHVLEAAATAISWIRARRAQWSEPIEFTDLLEADEPYESREPQKPRDLHEPEFRETIGGSKAIEPSDEPEDDSGGDGNAAGRFSGFVPRAAAAGVAIAAAAIFFWPRIFGSSEPGAVPPSAQTTQDPVAPQPAATPDVAATTPLQLTPDTTIGVTANEPAEVLIDGTRVGETPYEGRVGLGPHTVTVKTAGAERQLTVEATSKPVQLEVDFSKP